MQYRITFRIRLGSEITRLREDKGWSQRFLAKKAGVSSSTVQNVEYGWSHITLFKLAKICWALELLVEKVLSTVGTEDAWED